MFPRKLIRLVFASLIVLSVLALANGATSSSVGQTDEQIRQANISTGDGKQIAPQTNNITVIATDSNTWMGNAGDGPRARAELVAFNPNGTALYYNDSHTRYWDIDPVEGTNTTVEYLYADHLNKSECGTEVCTRNGVERVNLSTGEVTDIYSRVTPGKHSTRWHDGDRINKSTYAIADIAQDRVFAVNTTTGLLEWSWEAQNDFDPKKSGGPYPEDWTHLNDIEVLDDGRLMVSLRNHDQVVFLDRKTGLEDNWTLGSDDQHNVIYEQHNPDYIPKSGGGPAVLIGDSENNRVVEYQRENDEWNQTWTWQDSQMQWPRDADRLPNGHTLITDSNGNRVLEVNQQGDVVWSVDIAFPYEAERLETGDESTNGQSASVLGLASKSPNEASTVDTDVQSGQKESIVGRSWIQIKNIVPGRYMNALMYVLPAWMGPTEVFALFALALGLLAWAAAEWHWSSRSLTIPWTIHIKRKG
ncbi:arylsulfotransferase family protein [Haladaptatus pallidirubidus]|uniref:Arylsulfotransferase (ASST) n=2 Tax=Haladaptatus pallidirubidus TaxID=1008152 RepID=A0AAV3UGZ9_9EURY|nr:arylsulfotransferase family protein [Haladaptatus pallidirubidus]